MSDIHEARLEALRTRMAETGTDLLVLGPSSHMVWLTGLSPHGDERPVMLLVSQSFAGFLMPALNVDSSRAKTDLPFFAWEDAEGPDTALAALIAETGVDPRSVHVAIDETMRADFALLLLDALPGADRTFTPETLGALRVRKDEAERAAIKKAHQINDRAVSAAFAALEAGITEIEIAEIIAASHKAEGAATQFTSVCFGANGAYPHHHNSETPLRPGEAILIDAGCRIAGYPSDMTRVGHFGDPPEGFAEVHAIVERAVQAGLDAARPGAMAKEVDGAARNVIAQAGYGEYFVHRTGHGLGIDIHEPPYITGTSETVLESGMVFSIEPGIYLPGRFGIRLEEIVILTETGPEIFSGLPRTAVGAR